MRLGDFSAGILVDGVELEECDITIEPPPLSPPHLNTAEKKTTCWIASAENKKFTIQWKCHSETRELAYSGRIYVDGVRCKSNIMLRGRLGQHDTIRRTNISDSRVRRDLMFSRVEDTGEDVSLNTGTPLVDDDDAGEIVIKIVAGCVGKTRVSTKPRESLCPDARTMKVREGSGSRATDMAAAIHCISLAEAVPRTTVPTTSGFTRNKHPPTVFVFKYRPLGESMLASDAGGGWTVTHTTDEWASFGI
ncbi:hypothetical protein BJ138DRAFT_946286 [Hygrophoropsis aurantiaca]|uniref:Uncharacterized protein n=1 Tax=Hygrophoropsis aurantiaca TaxID=72124 RepID=A0ACB7ZTQ4_9AGAM|nr:hypothetical protein BJ138DRAFT_946286 [Hygrophoropsis aurantiaca]